MEKQPPISVDSLLSRPSRQGFCRPAGGALTPARRLVTILAVWLAFGLVTHRLLMGADGVALAAAAPVISANAMPATSAPTVAPVSNMNTSRCCVATCSGAMSSCPLMFAAKPALPFLAEPLVRLSVRGRFELTADRPSFISALAARTSVGPPTQALLQVFLL